MAVPEELMEILVCPDCHGDLEEREAPDEELDSVLVCLACGLAYPVRDGIPIMLIEEAFRPPDSPSPERGGGRGEGSE